MIPPDIMKLWSCRTCNAQYTLTPKDYPIHLCDRWIRQDEGYPSSSYPDEPFEKWCEPCYKPKMRYLVPHAIYRLWSLLKGELEYRIRRKEAGP